VVSYNMMRRRFDIFECSLDVRPSNKSDMQSPRSNTLIICNTLEPYPRRRRRQWWTTTPSTWYHIHLTRAPGAFINMILYYYNILSSRVRLIIILYLNYVWARHYPFCSIFIHFNDIILCLTQSNIIYLIL